MVTGLSAGCIEFIHRDSEQYGRLPRNQSVARVHHIKASGLGLPEGVRHSTKSYIHRRLIKPSFIRVKRSSLYLKLNDNLPSPIKPGDLELPFRLWSSCYFWGSRSVSYGPQNKHNSFLYH